MRGAELPRAGPQDLSLGRGTLAGGSGVWPPWCSWVRWASCHGGLCGLSSASLADVGPTTGDVRGGVSPASPGCALVWRRGAGAAGCALSPVPVAGRPRHLPMSARTGAAARPPDRPLEGHLPMPPPVSRTLVPSCWQPSHALLAFSIQGPRALLCHLLVALAPARLPVVTRARPLPVAPPEGASKRTGLLWGCPARVDVGDHGSQSDSSCPARPWTATVPREWPRAARERRLRPELCVAGPHHRRRPQGQLLPVHEPQLPAQLRDPQVDGERRHTRGPVRRVRHPRR